MGGEGTSFEIRSAARLETKDGEEEWEGDGDYGPINPYANTF